MTTRKPENAASPEQLEFSSNRVAPKLGAIAGRVLGLVLFVVCAVGADIWMNGSLSGRSAMAFAAASATICFLAWRFSRLVRVFGAV